MKSSTHGLFGIFLILLLYKEIPVLDSYTPMLFGVPLAYIGALTPDLDHPSNSGLISFISTHRGWTHSIFGAIVFSVFVGYIFVLYDFNFSYVFPFSTGYISHLVLDSLTPTGVKWLFPYKKDAYTLNWIVTDSKRESFLNTVLKIMVVFELFDLFSPK